mgnify:FL=1
MALSKCWVYTTMEPPARAPKEMCGQNLKVYIKMMFCQIKKQTDEDMVIHQCGQSDSVGRREHE